MVPRVLENPKVRDVLVILGITGLVTASLVFPGLPAAIKPFVSSKKRKQKEEFTKVWDKYNLAKLRFLIKRLHQQKVVEVTEGNGEAVVILTDKGKKKMLTYKFEEMMISKPNKWDGKWRLIIYDVGKEKRMISEIFRRFLRKMMFLKLQKSVYLTPYECRDQIEFLRQYYGLGTEVVYLVVEKIEQDEAYKRYFGI